MDFVQKLMGVDVIRVNSRGVNQQFQRRFNNLARQMDTIGISSS